VIKADDYAALKRAAEESISMKRTTYALFCFCVLLVLVLASWQWKKTKSYQNKDTV